MVGVSTDVKFFLGYIFGSILTLVIQDWLAERSVRKIEKEGIGKWLSQ